MDPLSIYSKISNLRVGLTPTASVTSTVTTLLGNVNVSSNLSIGGQISNNVLGALSMRAYDDTGIYNITNLTAGVLLPLPFTTKPIMEQQVTSLNLTSTQFGTISSGYSLKINGYVQPPATGTYLFRATYRDGLTLYVASQKLIDSWLYQGNIQQAVGTLTMFSNVWAAFAIEHTAGSSERLLIEWANPGGTFTTMNSSNFTFAYDMKEVSQSLVGSSYFYGRTNFADTANFFKGAYLPNATSFTGNTSELTNDAIFVKNGGTALSIAGTVTATALNLTGTSSGTVLQLANTIGTLNGTVSTTSYAALGMTQGTALDAYALNSHRWWTGSTGTTSGTVSMQLSTTALTVAGTVSAQALSLIGTASGTVLQLANTVATIGGTVTTTSYAALGVTPGTALDRYALISHRWWTGSSGTTSGNVAMSLSNGGNLNVSGILSSAYQLNVYWQQSGTLSLPSNSTIVIPASVWTILSSYLSIPPTLSSGTIMASSGNITIPIKGIYCLTWAFDLSVSQNPFGFWFNHPVLGRLASANYNTLAFAVNSGAWTGLLLPNDVISPTIYLSTSTSFPAQSPPSVYNCITLTLINSVP